MAMDNRLYEMARAKRKRLVSLVRSGMTIKAALADPGVNVGVANYQKWRTRWPDFAAEMDIARGVQPIKEDEVGELTRQQFALRYFGMTYAGFQMRFINEVDTMRRGNIVMVLFPPEHGKTTTFENMATEDIARNNEWRITVASEGLRISQKIVGRVRNRFEPEGPMKRLVKDFGPFKAPTGMGREQAMQQPWSNSVFNVYGKQSHDERDYNMQALGYRSSIVSTRCDHLHLDDLQSLKTLGESEKVEEWVRQDALSRPGENGKTSIVGTRVGDNDVFERLENDDELYGIMRVIKLPAIVPNAETGEPEPLWPQLYTMEQLDRQRRKVGPDAWDRNYMQNPGASRKREYFNDGELRQCLDYNLHWGHIPAERPIMYLALDPAYENGKNCVMAVSIHPRSMTVRWIAETTGLRSNEDIMLEVAKVADRFHRPYTLTDLIVESMNFQAGLARDERLQELRDFYGFAAREHLTGLNKYDPDIGVPSMATSFRKKEIVLPYGDDAVTRYEIEELMRQLRAWRPAKVGGVTVKRGNKQRQDRVMALWFAWILWQNRWKSDETPEDAASAFDRGVPYDTIRTGPIMPIASNWR